MTEPDLTLYGLRLSGHSHRAELFLSLLGLPFRFVEAASAAQREAAAFGRLNPLGQIPVLTDGDAVIADSNAILVYLAARYAPHSGWMPGDPLGAAQVQRWLSIAAGEVRYGPALARLMVVFGVQADRATVHAAAARILAFMDSHLADRRYLATDRATLADIACYSYVAHAPEGGVSLAPYPAVRAWVARVEALPGFVPMPASPIPEPV
ncbi:glutathione S-transferase [Methylobacterium sp. J-088]|uniref:glutathione S-transferase family protein n=1 Tax=unclassified Methylobacterium TaxID=2615210 RepID=UPI001FB8FB38|nr:MULTISPECIES: glutathione S-transferase [unclassified Methylobacterium]MCJ2066762.1 glutathione S-transferase [Methylobacterium sp. J-088]